MTVAYALALFLQFPATAQPPIDERVACAPMNAVAAQAPAVGSSAVASPGRLMFGPGEQVVVSGGAAQGLQAGQDYFIRRSVKNRFTPASKDFTPNSVHTTGWLRVVDVQGSMSVATITHACDAVFEGDYLEPFVAPQTPGPANPAAQPDFTNPGRIVLADERRQMGYPGLLMLINRGSDHGLQAARASPSSVRASTVKDRRSESGRLRSCRSPPKSQSCGLTPSETRCSWAIWPRFIASANSCL